MYIHTQNMYFVFLVVIWSHVLGGVQRREEPLPWGESDGCNGVTGKRREDGTTEQLRLHQGNVSKLK